GLAGCALGMIPALAALSGAELLVARWRWTPPFGDVVLGIDRLSAFFLVPLLVLAGVALVYSRPYLLHGKRRPLGAPVLFFNLLIASMVLIVLARDAIVLIIGWEAMGLSS